MKKEKKKKDQSKHFQRHFPRSKPRNPVSRRRFIVATATFRDKRKKGGGEKLAGISYGW